MGRAADSERIKLKAMFFNNMGVAAAVAGFAIPVFAFMSHGKETVRYLFRFIGGELSPHTPEFDVIVDSIGTLVLVCCLAVFFRLRADDMLKKLED